MAEMKGRDLVRHWLDGRFKERPPIVLHFGSYAARLQQLGYRQMSEDATLLANSLQGAARLFDCDGLILLADPTVEAEACGCGIEWRDDEPFVVTHPLGRAVGGVACGATARGLGDAPSLSLDLASIEGRGRMAALLEAANRLAAVVGKDRALIPAVTGPVTLASHLWGPAFRSELDDAREGACCAVEAAAQVTLQLGRRYLDMGFEQLVIWDPELGRTEPAHFPAIASALRPLWNVAEFYDAQVLLSSVVDDAACLESLCEMGAHGVLIEIATGCGAGPGSVGDAGFGPVGGAASMVDRPVGVGVPGALLEHDGADLEEALVAWRGETCGAGTPVVCLSIPRSTPPANLHTLLRVLRR